MMFTISCLVAFLAACVQAKEAAAVVPHNRPIVGNYAGPLRPQVHFSPPKHFMNDPNGMFKDNKGVWHLYYQYNPTANVAGNQHWGHATSKDLYHWVNQKIALFPVNASSYIFSGSCVVDEDNTSGFFPHQDNGVVAIYTIATYEPIRLQTQGIAVSYDSGYTFEPYKNNPVLDIGSSQFRDPKVIRYGNHWVMVISYASDYVIGFYTSKNLKHWTHASNFSHKGLLGVQYECPNLVEMPIEGTKDTMWLLQISINPGAPLGGSISEYFPGTFDGYRFTAVDDAARINDFGKDNYAGQFFYGLPKHHDAVSMAWISNWEYAQSVPTGTSENWRSSMGVPRAQRLRRLDNALNWALVSAPYNIDAVKGRVMYSGSIGNASKVVDYSTVYSNALYFEVSMPAKALGKLNFTFYSPQSGETLRAGLVMGEANPYWIDRGGIKGFNNPYFTDKFSQHIPAAITHVAGVIDRSVLEMFGNNGEISATNTFFPNSPLTQMTVSAGEITPASARLKINVWALHSAWKQYQNSNGFVIGNRTVKAAKEMVRRHPKMIFSGEV